MDKGRKNKMPAQIIGRTLCFLVEARGVEPLSEDVFAQLSPSASDYLRFPRCDVNRQTSHRGSLLVHDAPKGKGTFTFTAKSRSNPGRGTPGQNGC